MGNRIPTKMTVDEYLAEVPENIREISEKLRTLLNKSVPEQQEAVYAGWKLIGYRVVNGKKSHYFAFIAPWPDRVVLGFEYGIYLFDPEKILEGNGTQVRQITFRKAGEIKSKQLLPLILEAAELALNKRKK